MTLPTRRWPAGRLRTVILTGVAALAVAAGTSVTATSAAASTSGHRPAASPSAGARATAAATTRPAPDPTDRTVGAGVRVDQATTTRVHGLSFTTIAPGVTVAPAYGSTFTGAHGTYIRFAPGAYVPRHHYSAALHGVLLSGRLANTVDGDPASQRPLHAGDSFALPEGAEHTDRCLGPTSCLLFMYQDFGFEPVFP